MTAIAAYTKSVKVKDLATSGASFIEVPAVNASLNHGGDVLDDTEMKNNAGFRSRLYGLRDWSVTINVTWDATDTGLLAIRNAWLNRTALDCQYLPDGTTGNGFQGNVRVDSINLSGDVGGLETADISLVADGALAAAS